MAKRLLLHLLSLFLSLSLPTYTEIRAREDQNGGPRAAIELPALDFAHRRLVRVSGRTSRPPDRSAASSASTESLLICSPPPSLSHPAMLRRIPTSRIVSPLWSAATPLRLRAAASTKASAGPGTESSPAGHARLAAALADKYPQGAFSLSGGKTPLFIDNSFVESTSTARGSDVIDPVSVGFAEARETGAGWERGRGAGLRVGFSSAE